MKAIVVDDEVLGMEHLKGLLEGMDDFSCVKGFTDPLLALEHCKKHYVDVVFLDVRMPGMDGVTLAREIMDFSPDTNIIFATGYSHYLAEAFALHASGYIMKPVTKEAVVHEVKNLRFPPRFSDRGLRVQTFGNFEVFFDSRNVEFNDDKAKEIFAFLIDHQGEEVSLKELAAAVYPNQAFDIPTRKMLNSKIAILKETLHEAGDDKAIVSNWGKLSVDKNVFRCDLYDLLDGKPSAISQFNGHYMVGYGWAGEKLSRILKRKF